MSIRKYLGRTALTLGLAGVLATSAIGCGFGHKDYTNPEYDFNRNIGNERVNFYEQDSGKKNYLEVTGSNGIVIRFVDDKGNDLKLERIEITQNGKTETFRDIDVQKRAYEEGQRKFNNYLTQIAKIKEEEALKALTTVSY